MKSITEALVWIAVGFAMWLILINTTPLWDKLFPLIQSTTITAPNTDNAGCNRLICGA